jgi:hypothetical protein
MVERVSVDVGGNEGLCGALFRYGVLERMSRIARSHDVGVLAWGFARGELRVILEGTPTDIATVLRGLRVGTTRAIGATGIPLTLAVPIRTPLQPWDLEAAVTWAHRAPIEGTGRDPLESPWSSHRDLLGFRMGDAVDLARLEGRVDPRRIHAALGGEALPSGWPPPLAERANLTRLLRVAAGVLGVLPADRRCFRLFVHLARHEGWQSADIAGALALTTRRVRQLGVEPEPFLGLARVTLGSAALSNVP